MKILCSKKAEERCKKLFPNAEICIIKDLQIELAGIKYNKIYYDEVSKIDRDLLKCLNERIIETWEKYFGKHE